MSNWMRTLMAVLGLSLSINFGHAQLTNALPFIPSTKLEAFDTKC